MAHRIHAPPSPASPPRPFAATRRHESATRVHRIRAAPTDAQPVSDEALEARLIYETRASAERRLAVAGAENDKATRRVRVSDRADRTLVGMSALGPLPLVPEATSSRDESLRIAVDLSSMMRTARRGLRRRRTVRVLGLLSFVVLGAWFVMVLRAHDPGFARTRVALAGLVHRTFSAP